MTQLAASPPKHELPIAGKLRQAAKTLPAPAAGFVRWVAGLFAVGYVLSVAVHALAVATLSLAVIGVASAPKVNGLFGAIADAPGDDDVEGIPDGGATFELPAGEPFDSQAIAEVAPASGAASAVFSLEGAARGGEPGSGGDGGARGEGHKYAMPKGGGVVAKGSFSVWTVPADPMPGQQYSIIIQIKMPERVRQYRTDDLSGVIVGTDKYRQLIPGADLRNLPVKNRSVQWEVRVPGASRLVEDTIRIRSRLLNESQEIKIVF